MPCIDLTSPTDPSAEALARLISIPAVADEAGALFAAAGHQLYLVGGSVRDLLLGRGSGVDLDFATDASPEVVLELVRGWAHAVWTTGIAFGTVGLRRGEATLEVTTYRTEAYRESSRNPVVQPTGALESDLARRDFTVNALAVSVPGHVFVDLHEGLKDLAAGRLRTPVDPRSSFGDDPLRILRAARLHAQLTDGERVFAPTSDVVAAMGELASRLEIVAPERIRDELTKLLLAPDPVPALRLLVDTGVADYVLPELGKLRLERDEHHRHKDVYEHTLQVLRRAIALEPAGADLVLRLAALLHDVGKPATRAFGPGGTVTFHHHEVRGAALARRRLVALRFDREVVTAVVRLVELHLRFHGYGTGEWTDSAVRRYVVDAGPELARLHLLVRSDCTTRNPRRAAALAAAYDELEERIAELGRREELAAIRPDLDGNEIMDVLGLPPGPLVGRARAHLLDLRMEHGPLDRDRAVAELRSWAAELGIGGFAAPSAGSAASPRGPADSPD